MDLSKRTIPELETMMVNARRQNDDGAYRAALRRKIELSGGSADDPLDVEMAQVIAAVEQVHFVRHGRRLQAGRLRPKYRKDGAQATFEYLASQAEATDGFRYLVEHGMPKFTAEHVVLRYPDRFSDKARATAIERLREAGVAIPAV